MYVKKQHHTPPSCKWKHKPEQQAWMISSTKRKLNSISRIFSQLSGTQERKCSSALCVQLPRFAYNRIEDVQVNLVILKRWKPLVNARDRRVPQDEKARVLVLVVVVVLVVLVVLVVTHVKVVVTVVAAVVVAVVVVVVVVLHVVHWSIYAGTATSWARAILYAWHVRRGPMFACQSAWEIAVNSGQSWDREKTSTTQGENGRSKHVLATKIQSDPSLLGKIAI